MESDSQDTFRDAVSDGSWRFAAAYIGLPVEEEADVFEAQPWVTCLLILVCIFATLWGLRHATFVTEHLAFHAGARGFAWLAQVFTHFFMHAGFLHLAGNMYFLWVFGDNVEDELGKSPYLALIGLATLAGCLLFARFDPQSLTVPAVGASGGIFGIVTYYILRFRQRKLVVLWFPRSSWNARLVALPAWIFGILYLALPQLAGSVGQMMGGSKVSYVSHLGGGLVGAMFAFLNSNRESRMLNDA